MKMEERKVFQANENSYNTIVVLFNWMKLFVHCMVLVAQFQQFKSWKMLRKHFWHCSLEMMLSINYYLRKYLSRKLIGIWINRWDRSRCTMRPSHENATSGEIGMNELHPTTMTELEYACLQLKPAETILNFTSFFSNKYNTISWTNRTEWKEKQQLNCRCGCFAKIFVLGEKKIASNWIDVDSM